MGYLITMLGIFLGDEAVKQYMEKTKETGYTKDILNGAVTLTKHHNKGAALNYLEDKPELVRNTVCGVFGACFIWYLWVLTLTKNTILKVGASVFMGGALSNLFDRIQRGFVVDYFTVNWGKLKKVIFNISDFMILFGGILILTGELLRQRKK